MAGAGVKIKIMPDSPNANLAEIEKKAVETIESEQGVNCKAERQPIAFGLNAIIITFAWDEGKDREDLENKLKNIEHVNSAEVISFVRAFG